MEERIYDSPAGPISLENRTSSTGSVVHPVSSTTLSLLKYFVVLENQDALDLGTGCGLLGISAAKQGARVWATDIDEEIGEVVLRNAERNGVNLTYQVSNGFETLKGKTFDWIVANMPQTPAPKPIRLDKWGGVKGSQHLEKLLQDVLGYLNSTGALLMSSFSLSEPQKIKSLASRYFSKQELKEEIHIPLDPERYEQFQEGLWNYLFNLREKGEAEFWEDRGGYFALMRIYLLRR